MKACFSIQLDRVILSLVSNVNDYDNEPNRILRILNSNINHRNSLVFSYLFHIFFADSCNVSSFLRKYDKKVMKNQEYCCLFHNFDLESSLFYV